MKDRAPIVARMTQLLREQGRTIAWLGDSLGVPPHLLRRLVDGQHDIPGSHFMKVKRWVDIHPEAAPKLQVAAPPRPDVTPYLRDPARLHSERASRGAAHPTRCNAVLSREVDQLKTEVASLRERLDHHIEGAQPCP